MNPSKPVARSGIGPFGATVRQATQQMTVDERERELDEDNGADIESIISEEEDD